MNINGGNREKGFTLLELMVAVGVVGILAAIAFPTYSNYVIRGKRAEGRILLMDTAARLERYYSDNNRYAAVDNTLPTGINSVSENGYYTLSISITGSHQAYILTATPATFSDTECGNLTLDQTGKRNRTGTASVADCWGR